MTVTLGRPTVAVLISLSVRSGRLCLWCLSFQARARCFLVVGGRPSPLRAKLTFLLGETQTASKTLSDCFGWGVFDGVTWPSQRLLSVSEMLIYINNLWPGAKARFRSQLSSR